MSSFVPGYNKMVFCPYNRSHSMEMGPRFQRHLIICKRQHPHIVLEVCPFDATHLFHKEDMDAHVTECSSRAIFDLHLYNVHDTPTTSNPKPATPKPTTSKPPAVKQEDDEENWDDCNNASYDPKKEAMAKNVLRKPGLSTKSERRKFRGNERGRLSRLKRGNNSEGGDK